MSGEMVPSSGDEFLLYQTADGQSRIEVRIKGETVWLSLTQMAELFGRDKSVISRHIANVFEEGELAAGSVVADFATTAADGKTYQVSYYNLDVIISVGYRVKSLRGTQFRIWATQRLREYIVKGFTMDDQRLRALCKWLGRLSLRLRTDGCFVSRHGLWNPILLTHCPRPAAATLHSAHPFAERSKNASGGRYFDELLARIRDIRSAERVFWRKVLDIYATSIFSPPGTGQSGG